MRVKSVLFAVSWQVRCYILNKLYAIFHRVVSVVYYDFLNIHILCTGGDYPSLLGASYLHASFSLEPDN